MSVPVGHLTVEEAHKELKLLVDKIGAKYDQLESGKVEAVGAPAFNAKSVILASLFAHIRKLCETMSLQIRAQLHRLPFFKH